MRNQPPACACGERDRLTTCVICGNDFCPRHGESEEKWCAECYARIEKRREKK